jgi:hypothetical protein
MRAELQAGAAVMDHIRRTVLPDRQKRAVKEAAKNAELLAADPNRNVTWHQKNFLDKWWELASIRR